MNSRGFWYRIWCAMRGHGGITPMPGSHYFGNHALCKHCGGLVTLVKRGSL